MILGWYHWLDSILREFFFGKLSMLERLFWNWRFRWKLEKWSLEKLGPGCGRTGWPETATSLNTMRWVSYEGVAQANSYPQLWPHWPDFSFTTHGQKVSFYLENSYLFVFKFLPRGLRAPKIHFEKDIAVGFYMYTGKSFPFKVRLMWLFTIMEWIKPHIISLGDI